MPEIALRPIFNRMFRLGAWPYPAGVLDYLKFPVSIDGDRFAAATGYKPRVDLVEMFEGMRQ